jgi:hypothetical protein
MTDTDTPKDWLSQAAARDAARQRWLRLATAKRPNTLLVASAESELFAAGGDMCDLQLLRQRAKRILEEATNGKV